VSVADILQQMAVNAGRAPLARGALIANTIAGAAAIPGQIIDDRERHRVQQLQEARQAEQLGFQRNADTRATADQAAQDAAVQLEAKKRAVMKLGVAAGFGDSADPKQFDVARAAKAVTDAGFPELATSLSAFHDQLLPKLTEFDPTKGSQDAAGNVVRQPAAKVMTPAEQAQRDETARHNKESERISALTEGRTEAAQKETARHNRAMEVHAAKAADPFGGQGGASGIDLEKVPQTIRDQAQALVDGRRQLDPRLAGKPLGQTIINTAYALDSTFDQGNYNARYKARTDLTNPGGTGGKTIGALNTAIQHAGKLSELIEKLDNYESPLANAIVNPIRSQMGKTEVTNYDTVAPQLAKEIERVWRGAGGTAGEIHDLIETIGHNKGKQQQREALQQFVELAKGKLDTLEQQRDNVMGKKAGAAIPILFEQNKPIIETIAQRAGGAAAAAAAPTLGANATNRVVQNGVTYDVTTDAAGKVISSKAVKP
jgi:hypothetical protein